MWTLQGFLDYFFLESEEEDKTGSITALLYTEETVQDELFSSCSISLPINKQVRQNSVVWGKALISAKNQLLYYNELSLGNVVNIKYPKKDLTEDASTVMDYGPRLYACLYYIKQRVKAFQNKMCTRFLVTSIGMIQHQQ